MSAELFPRPLNVEVQGPHDRDGDEVTVTIGSTAGVTYTLNDQVGSDSYEITNFFKKSTGKSELSFLTWVSSIYTTTTTGKLDVDLIFWDSPPSTGSSDGDPFSITAANLNKYQGHLEIRENHWSGELGVTDRFGQVPPAELGHELSAATTSVYFSVVYRGADFSIATGETLKFKFGSRYLDK